MVAVGQRRPDQLRHRVGDGLEAALAPLQLGVHDTQVFRHLVAEAALFRIAAAHGGEDPGRGQHGDGHGSENETDADQGDRPEHRAETAPEHRFRNCNDRREPTFRRAGNGKTRRQILHGPGMDQPARLRGQDLADRRDRLRSDEARAVAGPRRDETIGVEDGRDPLGWQVLRLQCSGKYGRRNDERDHHPLARARRCSQRGHYRRFANGVACQDAGNRQPILAQRLTGDVDAPRLGKADAARADGKVGVEEPPPVLVQNGHEGATPGRPRRLLVN
ncbi:MAG: hypothetical protein FD152_4388 [Xanthobacteraceae bacterium]|nr:MAG: hypothetical protein FD152_4388 [Xanthobacteraceae bacterium]